MPAISLQMVRLTLSVSERVLATPAAKLKHVATPAVVKNDATSACDTRKVHGKARHECIDESDDEEACVPCVAFGCFGSY